MHIVRYRAQEQGPRIGVLADGRIRPLPVERMADALRLPLADFRAMVEQAASAAPSVDAQQVSLLPPIDGRTEVWASGVTYLRSREARVEESTQRSVYELVYDAVRPELFFKAPAWRVVTDGEPVAIRPDSELDVPEPELAVVANSSGEIVGHLVCNDMSSRSIEGENPLYLPQAKVYAGSCALSVGIRPAWEVEAADLAVGLRVDRGGETVFAGSTSTAQLRRRPAELVGYLFRAENFPDGAVLSTGTGIVPEVSFTLAVDDVVTVEIQEIGTLVNTVVSGRERFDFVGAAGR